MTDDLAGLPTGPLTGEHLDRAQRILADVWSDLAGGRAQAMDQHKLTRIESAWWEPPILTFDIERHGALTLGSTRAEVQTWVVDLKRMTAEITRAKRRQLEPMAPRLDVRPIAEEVARHIVAGDEVAGLKWNKDRSTVRVVASHWLPPAVQQTMTGRRRRLLEAMGQALTDSGWVSLGDGRFQRAE